MTTHDEDRDLRDRYAALRAADAELDPGFAAPERRASQRRSSPPSRGWLQRAAWPALAAALAASILWLALPGRRAHRPPRVAPQLVPIRWAMPTDALLDLSGLPGDALLRGLPELGTPPPAPAGARSDIQSEPSRATARRPLA